MAEPGIALRLDERALEGLGRELNCYIDDLEQQHSLKFREIDILWRLYEAVPRQKVRTFPWRGASNVVVPVIATATDALVPRLFNQMFPRNDLVWAARTRNEEMREVAISVADFLNWASFNEFDMLLPYYDHLLEMVVIGESVLALNWRTKERVIALPSSTRRRVRTQRVILSRGIQLEHVPREQMLWQPNRSIDESEIVVRQGFFTWTELVAAGRSLGWDEEALEAVRNAPETDSPAAELRREKARRDGTDTTLGERERVGEHDIRECHVELPLLDALGMRKVRDELPPDAPYLIVTLHRKTGKVLKVRPDPYNLGTKPFFDDYFRRRSGRPAGKGMAKSLEHIQAGITTMVNQAIDAVTRSNSLWIKTRDPRLQNFEFAPNQPVVVGDLGDIEVLNTQRSVSPEIAMVQLLQAYGERLAQVSDPQLGREVRMGGHPSPATSTLALLAEQGQGRSMTMRLLRRTASRLVTAIATMYQLFDTDPDGRIVRVLGQRDGAKVREWLFPRDETIFGNIELQLKSVDETLNPDVERQRAAMVMQMTQNYAANGLQLIALAENQQAPPGTREAALKVFESLTNAYRIFLEASDIDEIERFVVNLQQQEQSREQLFTQLRGVLQEAAGGPETVPEQGVGITPRFAAIGAPGQSGALAGLLGV